MNIGLTVGNLMALWKDADPDMLVEVSFGGVNGLVVQGASIDRALGGTHLTVGPISPAEVRRQSREGI